MIIHPSRPFSSLCFDDFFFFWVFLHICFSLFFPWALTTRDAERGMGTWVTLGAWSDHNGRPSEVSVVADQGTAPPRTAALSERRRRPSAVRRDRAGWQARDGPVGPSPARPGPARLGRGIVRPALVGSQPQPAPASLGRVVDPPRSSGSLVVLSFVRRAQVLACLLAGWLAMVVGLGFCNQTLASHRTLSTPELSQLDL